LDRATLEEFHSSPRIHSMLSYVSSFDKIATGRL
jgi:hypothetical protein